MVKKTERRKREIRFICPFAYSARATNAKLNNRTTLSVDVGAGLGTSPCMVEGGWDVDVTGELIVIVLL